MGLGILTSFLLFTCASWGNLLVVEYKEPRQSSYHGDTVKQIACDDPSLYCELYNTEFFLEDFKTDMVFKLPQFDVVNMSFGFQKPEFKPPPGPPVLLEAILTEPNDFEKQKENFKKLFIENPEVLFVAAAGNGFELGPAIIKSVPLTDHYKIFPASLESSNLITITAVQESGLSFTDLEVKTIGDKVNYGLEKVDVAAVVEPNHLGETLIFTSTATPHVSRIAALIKKSHPVLSAKQIKEILMKTVYVKNIDRVLEIEEDYLNNKSKSLLGKLRLEKNYFKREELRKEIGDILLVKSGGTVVPEAAQLCADIYDQAIGLLTLEQSCLQAQKTKLYLNQVREEKLKKLWGIRGL